MRDLRKKVLLQSGKTQSKRAKAREEREDPRSSSELAESTKSPGTSPRSSPFSSRAGSRNNSRPGSRYASEDEGDSDDHFEAEESEYESGSDFDEDIGERGWVARLRTRITQLQEFRERNFSQRETALASYLHILRNYNATGHIEGSYSDIFASLFNSIKRGASEKEILTAVNALSATLITSPNDTVYNRVSKPLRVLCEESDSENVKVAAMNALAVALAFGGGEEPDFPDICEFLLEIVESDGQSVGAEDNGVVVAGALQAWGCAASYVEDLAEFTEDGRAMEAFLEQLESTDVDVQLCAGYNIAQLFEAARTREQQSGQDAGLQHNQHLALSRMTDIVKKWTKRTSKRDRRLLKDEFPSIIISIEQGVGPGYIDERLWTRDSDPNEYSIEAKFHERPTPQGLQKKERAYKGGYNKTKRHDSVDDWKCHARLAVLKQVLVGGIELHWLENPAVTAALKAPRRRVSDEEVDEDDDEGGSVDEDDD
ncbi:Interferon-related developmental regulator (IFRD) domain containing protein [Naviculisporaceae sp. PSN 640]